MKKNKRAAISFKDQLKFEMETIVNDLEGKFMLVQVKFKSKIFFKESVYASVRNEP